METLKRFFPSASTRALWPLAIAAVVLIVLGNSSVARASDETTVRWDIIHVNPPTVVDLTAGGSASALASDGSKITVTGSGTFKIEEGKFENVTGGGNWTIGTASGTYKAKEVVAFTPAPGGLVPAILNDRIGNRADASSGLLVLRISYSDGSKGSLVVSCDLPAGATPPGIFEGITATKGFVGFWNNLPPVGGVDANRTIFHITPEDEKD